MVILTIYYPFGMIMPGRHASSENYRYGFNGKEMDSEVGGTGNSYDYGFRIYNPRIAKFLSVDPLTKFYSMLTPYQFASNRPIDGIDLDGLEYFSVHTINDGKHIVVKLEDSKTTDGLIVNFEDGSTRNNFKYAKIQEYMTKRTRIINGVQYIPAESSSNRFADKTSDGLAANEQKIGLIFPVGPNDEILPKDYFDPNLQPIDESVIHPTLVPSTQMQGEDNLASKTLQKITNYVESYSKSDKVDEIRIFTSNKNDKTAIQNRLLESGIDLSKVRYSDQARFSDENKFEVAPITYKKAKQTTN